MASRFDLLEGQQCARDFFLCLQKNVDSWPEVVSMLEFKMIHSTTCDTCNRKNLSETSQMYFEIEVPQNTTKLNEYLEDIFNQGDLVTMKCEENCKKDVQAQKKSQIKCGLETKFITVVLKRAIATDEGYEYNNEKIDPVGELYIRYVQILHNTTNYFFHWRDYNGQDHFYEAIAVIDYKGKFFEDGKSGGHYTCDVREKNNRFWYKTNDNNYPMKIQSAEVSKQGYVILFERL